MARKKMPKQKPGRSKQDYQTPRALLDATRKFLDTSDFWIDLAATKKNRVVARYYGRKDDSLDPRVSWRSPPNLPLRWGWLNPPFAQIGPWVQKAYEQSQRGARIAMLVPAAVGSNWWRDWVHEKAHVLLLNGRITFVGADQGYPKDCVILLYGKPPDSPHYVGSFWYRIWRWTDQE